LEVYIRKGMSLSRTWHDDGGQFGLAGEYLAFYLEEAGGLRHVATAVLEGHSQKLTVYGIHGGVLGGETDLEINSNCFMR
jgi:hypothetical protein